MQRLTPFVGLLALLVVSVPSDLRAQEEEYGGEGGPCGAYSSCGFGHKMCGGLGIETNAHCGETCYVCIVEWEVCHAQCIPPDLVAMGQGAVEAYRAIMRSAARGDVAGILALAPKVGHYVVMNRSRMALQIRSCSGPGYTASLPADAGEWARALALL
jgi:hypothetical protein